VGISALVYARRSVEKHCATRWATHFFRAGARLGDRMMEVRNDVADKFFRGVGIRGEQLVQEDRDAEQGEDGDEDRPGA
jgi:hypothetical protein